MDTERIVYLTLKKAAQQLGVHEQTLRSWERRGLIRMARLPQSGYHCLLQPADEVRRLQKAMMADKTSARLRIEAPSQSAEALAEGRRLAGLVRSELVLLENAMTFDELMQARRGRQWLS